MGCVGIGCLFLVKFDMNLPFCNTQQEYSPMGEGEAQLSLSIIPGQKLHPMTQH